jgi:plasmid stabilization system protein ParE
VKVVFLAPAEHEFDDAIDYYNQQQPGLGFEFAAEVRRTIDRIVKLPQAWQLLSDNTRRCRLNRFPYGIIYSIQEAEIVIIAVMHVKRHPDSWRHRS